MLVVANPNIFQKNQKLKAYTYNPILNKILLISYKDIIKNIFYYSGYTNSNLVKTELSPKKMTINFKAITTNNSS